MTDRVIELKDLHWSFDNSEPTYTHKEIYSVKVDPTPCYSHDPKLVEEWLAKVEEKWKIPKNAPNFFLLNHEGVDRVNGTTSWKHDYDSPKDQYDRYNEKPFIVLNGKRIPPHPAMTRYLVAHEYGHAVDGTMAKERYKCNYATSCQREEYAKIRGLQQQAYYGPGTWANTPAEVLANDFRILVCGIETEFWPHPGIPRPETCQAIIDWWAGRLADLKAGVFRLQECEHK